MVDGCLAPVVRADPATSAEQRIPRHGFRRAVPPAGGGCRDAEHVRLYQPWGGHGLNTALPLLAAGATNVHPAEHLY